MQCLGRAADYCTSTAMYRHICHCRLLPRDDCSITEVQSRDVSAECSQAVLPQEKILWWFCCCPTTTHGRERGKSREQENISLAFAKDAADSSVQQELVSQQSPTFQKTNHHHKTKGHGLLLCTDNNIVRNIWSMNVSRKSINSKLQGSMLL